MHAFKIRNDTVYVPAMPVRGQVAPIGESVDIGAVPSPALALQDELARRLAGGTDDRLSPGLSFVVILTLGLLSWMPVVAAGWALLG